MIKSKLKVVILVVISLFMMITTSFASEIELTEEIIKNAKYHNPAPITVPETDVNLTLKNITKACNIYLLISQNMLKHNLEKFIENNENNAFLVEAEEAEKLKKYLEEEDYLSYIYYFREMGFDKPDNEVELRHYSFCLGSSELVGYYEIENEKYVQLKINPDENGNFKVILKDYLNKYGSSDMKFLIEEYGVYTVINVSDYPQTINPEKSNIEERNIVFEYMEKEDYNAIKRAINLTYLIIFIILILILITIIVILIKRYKHKKQEKEDRKFWKKKLTKEEKKIEKKKQRNQKRLEKLEAKRNKKKR